MRILSPTENKRLNELIGFAGIVASVLLALSLLSYSPADPSFNVAAAAPAGGPVRNWIGPFGSHLADLIFQLCGYTAFLLPVALFVLGMRWFRSQTIDAPWAKLSGSLLMFVFLPAELALLPLPPVRGAIPGGGLIGTILAGGLRAALKPVGANIVGLACVLTALFLTTRFSFSATAAWLRKPIAAEGYIGQLMGRVKDWRDARESKQMRRRIDEIKIAGRRPAPAQSVSTKESMVEELEPQEEEEERGGAIASREPAVIKFHHNEVAAPAKKSGPEPKIAKGWPATNCRRPRCCRMQSAARRWTRQS